MCSLIIIYFLLVENSPKGGFIINVIDNLDYHHFFPFFRVLYKTQSMVIFKQEPYNINENVL